MATVTVAKRQRWAVLLLLLGECTGRVVAGGLVVVVRGYWVGSLSLAQKKCILPYPYFF